MARGDFTIFEEFSDQLGQESHNFSSDTIKFGLIDNAITPLASSVSPTWGSYSANEVGTGGNYTADGETVAVTWTEVSGVAKLDDDASDLSWAQNGGGFTDAYWGILYNDDEATDAAIGFLDMNGPVSEVEGPVNVNWNPSGILQVTVL